MKQASSRVFFFGLAVTLAACSGAEVQDSAENNASYALGLDIGNNVKLLEADVDIDELVAGLRDVLEDREPRLSEQETREILQQFMVELQEQNAQRHTEQAETNLSEAQAFLVENGEREDVTVTASGLQYQVLTEGGGPSPTAADRVSVHYEGKTLDGNVFDSSYERGEPAEFAVNMVIPGWTEGVQLMKVGSKFRFFIHPELGYGPQGNGPDIGPNSLLLFDVELLGIVQ